MTTHIPRSGDWEIIGIINKHLTWLAIKPEAQVFVFGCQEHLETYHFEKGARISIRSGESGQELHAEPQKALIKRTVAA